MSGKKVTLRRSNNSEVYDYSFPSTLPLAHSAHSQEHMEERKTIFSKTAFHPNGSYFLTVTTNAPFWSNDEPQRIQVWDALTLECTKTVNLVDRGYSQVNDLKFHPRGHIFLLAFPSSDSEIEVWDASSFVLLNTIRTKYTTRGDWWLSFAFHPSREMLIVAGSVHKIAQGLSVCDASLLLTSKTLKETELEYVRMDVSLDSPTIVFHPVNEEFALLGESLNQEEPPSPIFVYDAVTYEFLRYYNTVEGTSIRTFVFHPSGHVLLGRDASQTFCDWETGEEISKFHPLAATSRNDSEERIESFTFHPLGNALVSTGSSVTVGEERTTVSLVLRSWTIEYIHTDCRVAVLLCLTGMTKYLHSKLKVFKDFACGWREECRKLRIAAATVAKAEGGGGGGGPAAPTSSKELDGLLAYELITSADLWRVILEYV